MGLHQGQPTSGTKNLSNCGNTPQVEIVLLYPGPLTQSTTETGRYTVSKCDYCLNSPQSAIDQLGHSLTRIMHAFTEAEEDARIFMAKWDIKDSFWRLYAEEGAKWNFAYVLPQHTRQPCYLVVSTSLQIEWVESPPFFCVHRKQQGTLHKTIVKLKSATYPHIKSPMT